MLAEPYNKMLKKKTIHFPERAMFKQESLSGTLRPYIGEACKGALSSLNGLDSLKFRPKSELIAFSPLKSIASTALFKKDFFYFICIVFTLIATAACSSHSKEAWMDLSARGAGYDFTPINFDVPPFALAGLLKVKQNSKDLVVYIEGDGRGVVRGRVSLDPTPTKAMGFELAKSDPAPAVLYLARVGQFQPEQTGKKYQEYWSNKRLSAESVKAASLALDRAKTMSGAQRLHLIGYSGGGGLAILLAQERSDVASLVTVAGLIDTGWWVKEKNFQPLSGSLNPADKAINISHIPQVHFYGVDDSIIPPAMSAHFQTLAPFSNFKRVEVNTNHWRLWPDIWASLLNQHALIIR